MEETTYNYGFEPNLGKQSAVKNNAPVAKHQPAMSGNYGMMSTKREDHSEGSEVHTSSSYKDLRY